MNSGMSSRKADNFLISKTASSMEATINSDDMLRQILLLLPAKSLIRLKCVSKHWQKLISSPSFGLDHTLRAPYSLSGFYFYTDLYPILHPVSLHGHQSLPTLSFLYGALDIKYVFYIQDSCNGLILCSHGDKLLYTVANPTTGKYNKIPLPPTRGFLEYPLLCFDPTESPYFKVVLVSYSYSFSCVIYTYSSEVNSWRSVLVDGVDSKFLQPRAFWDGAIHCLKDKVRHFIFDVDKEKLTENPLPRKAYSDSMFRFFGECGGDLLLVESHYTREYRIHEMRKGTRHWRLKQSVLINRINLLSLTYVLGVVKRSHTDDILLLLADTKRIFAYNTISNTMEELYDFSHTREGPSGFVSHFIESLIPI